MRPEEREIDQQINKSTKRYSEQSRAVHVVLEIQSSDTTNIDLRHKVGMQLDEAILGGVAEFMFCFSEMWCVAVF